MRFLGTWFAPRRTWADAYEAHLKAEWDGYLAWRELQRCSGCGKALKDARPGEIWACETECFPCFEDRCNSKKKNSA
jgi:hypothetical protein